MLAASSYPSTASLTSVTTTSTVTSTTPLRSNTSRAFPKSEEEFLAAFGALQNAYGFGGVAPTRPTISKSNKRAQKTPVATTISPSDTQSKPSSLTEQERTFAEFAVSYGFAGAAPTIPTVTRTQSSKSLKFWRRSAA